MPRASLSLGETAYMAGLALALTIALYGVLAGWYLLGDGDDDSERTILEGMLSSSD